jgi:hypothetical protein
MMMFHSVQSTTSNKRSYAEHSNRQVYSMSKEIKLFITPRNTKRAI